MPFYQAWRRIAEYSYGLSVPRLLDERRHFSHHYVISCGKSCYVLSRVQKSSGRLPFRLQFKIMSLLRSSGVQTVNTAVTARDGRPYVDDGPDYWWFLWQYRPNDNNMVVWRATPQLVDEAARALVPVHEAGSCDNVRIAALGGVDQTSLAPYYRSVEAFLDTLPARMPEGSALSPEDQDLLKRTLAELRASRQKMLDESRARKLVGVTHHDFRPDNLLVRGRRIVEIIDWDCAFIDHQLHDVAFAALQFGQRQCLRDADMGLAKVFINRYLTERGLDHLPRELIWWFLRFTVVKRLLIKGSNAERVRLLRVLADGPDSCL